MRLGLWAINIRNPILVKIYTINIQTLRLQPPSLGVGVEVDLDETFNKSSYID